MIDHKNKQNHTHIKKRKSHGFKNDEEEKFEVSVNHKEELDENSFGDLKGMD